MFCPWIQALLLTPRPDAAGIIQLAWPRVCCICRWTMRPTRPWVRNTSLSLSLSLNSYTIDKHDCAFLLSLWIRMTTLPLSCKA